MFETTCCPDCGAELPTGATGGLCPRCLLGAGLSSEAEPSPVDSPFAATTPQAGGFVPPTPASLAAYFPGLEVLEIIGQGGMGAVYKARQSKLARLVALKIIRPETADDPAFAERFTREARTLARLSHANIVAIHDFGEFSVAQPDSGQSRTLYFFIMEFVDGANLRELMQSGELQPAQSLAIVPQICDALQYAHDEGIIHRDIKPENILIDRRGRVKIADFGLAKLARQSPENFTLTGTHQVMGTPRYMAPEQMSGSRRVDHRADIYSLGVVLYEMLTGELPMGRFEDPSQKAAVDPRLDEVVHRALATDPDRRYQQASEVRADVDAITIDAISHGELDSVNASVASGFPGPSTIMERQVAGVVNWFKGGRTPAEARQPAPMSASDRAAIQQQVRGPAVALILFGGLIAAIACGPTIAGGAMIRDGRYNLGDALGLLLLAGVLFCLGGMIVRGGWNLLTLKRYRPAVMAALIGQPVGVWALTRLSRDEVRAAFTDDSPETRSLMASVFLNTTLWGVLMAVGGIVVIFQPWATIYNDASGDWASVSGFVWPHAMIACLILVLVVLFLLATAALRPVPVWRPIIVVLGAIVVLACCVSFVSALNSRTLVVRPLLDAASWGVEVEGQTPRTIGDWSGFVVQGLNRPYFLMMFAVGLLITAALDFRSAVRPVAATPRRRATRATAATISGKAILGACWAPLFFLAVAGFMVTSDVMSYGSVRTGIPVPGIWTIVPGAVVGILGLLAPFGTTILGIMAISDIRQSPSRLRGLGLAYFDVIFYPLLVLDVVLIAGLGFALSAVVPAANIVVGLFLVVPVCLILDAVLAVLGWRYVLQPSATVDTGADRQRAIPGAAPPNSERSAPTPFEGGAAVNTPNAPYRPRGTESSLTSIELRRIEMRVKAPAAGMMIVACLSLAFWCVQGFALAWDGWNMSGEHFTGSLAEVLGAMGAAVVVLLLVGTIFLGALHLRRLTGIGWCYAAAILVLIPWSGAVVIGFFVGIWVLNVLARPEVKEAFVLRSFETDRSH
jgi:tRNA A-37 threonylcarbamoyl transferase component Bud32